MTCFQGTYACCCRLAFGCFGEDVLCGSCRAGKHLIVFLEKGPFILVMASTTKEPESALLGQLGLVHGQILSILTSSVEKMFAKNPSYDVRKLLGERPALVCAWPSLDGCHVRHYRRPLLCLALPCPALLCPALPFCALCCPALPCPFLLCLALLCPASLAVPCPALPRFALLCPALSCLALPCPTLRCPGAVPCLSAM